MTDIMFLISVTNDKSHVYGHKSFSELFRVNVFALRGYGCIMIFQHT